MVMHVCSRLRKSPEQNCVDFIVLERARQGRERRLTPQSKLPDQRRHEETSSEKAIAQPSFVEPVERMRAGGTMVNG